MGVVAEGSLAFFIIIGELALAPRLNSRLIIKIFVIEFPSLISMTGMPSFNWFVVLLVAFTW